jgi:hypothetical protein
LAGNQQRPATSLGSSAIVFFSGIPSDAAGPVADTVTPLFTSAKAWPLHAADNPVATNAALIQRNADFIPLLDLPVIHFNLNTQI